MTNRTVGVLMKITYNLDVNVAQLVMWKHDTPIVKIVNLTRECLDLIWFSIF